MDHTLFHNNINFFFFCTAWVIEQTSHIASRLNVTLFGGHLILLSQDPFTNPFITHNFKAALSLGLHIMTDHDSYVMAFLFLVTLYQQNDFEISTT